MEEDLKTDRKSLAKTWGKRIERDGKTVGFATMSHELMEIMKGFVIAFLCGVLSCFLIVRALPKEAPEAFTIERDGKTVGFATMSHELMEIVKIEGKDVQSPGMFVAFPLYGSPDLKDEIDVEA